MTKGCIVPQCRTGFKNVKKKCSVFKVPSNPEKLKEWLAAIPGIVQLKPTQFVCEKHFEDRYILRKWIKQDANGRIIAEAPYKYPRLDTSAVPSIFNSNDVPDCSSNQIINDVIIAADPLNSDDESSAFRFIGEHIEGSSCTQYMENDDFLAMDETNVNSTTDVTDVDVELSLDPEKPPDKCEVLCQFDIISKIMMSICTSGAKTNSVMDEKSLISIPKSWSFAELQGDEGPTILFLYSVMKLKNSVKIPITERNIIISSKNAVSYYVYGRPIAAERHKLNGLLGDVQQLPQILDTFQNMNICNGLGAVDIHLVPIQSVIKDYVDRWHHKDCTMISIRKRCDCCIKMIHSIQKKQARLKKNGTLTRVYGASNPTDQKKLIALRKKNLRERRAKNRAWRRVQTLHGRRKYLDGA